MRKTQLAALFDCSLSLGVRLVTPALLRFGSCERGVKCNEDFTALRGLAADLGAFGDSDLRLLEREVFWVWTWMLLSAALLPCLCMRSG